MGKLSAPSTITSQPAPRIRSAFSVVRRSLKTSTVTSGLSAAIVRLADSAFESPRRSVEWTIWRWRLDSSTTSSSTIPSVPDAGRGEVERRRASRARRRRSGARARSGASPGRPRRPRGSGGGGCSGGAAARRADCGISNGQAVALPVGEAARQGDDVRRSRAPRASWRRRPSGCRPRSRRRAAGRGRGGALRRATRASRGGCAPRPGCGPRPTRRARGRRRRSRRPASRRSRADGASVSSISARTWARRSR